MEEQAMEDNLNGAVSSQEAGRFDRPPARGVVADDRGISELVKDLGEQTTTLVRQELELARAELTQKGKVAGIGAGMFGGAGLFGFFAFAALTTAIIAVLALAFDEVWPAALIVAVVYGAVAGVLALTGKKKVQQATPPVERTTESVKADVQSVKSHAKAGRA
jgi:uncharacterized membrane protein YqjE